MPKGEKNYRQKWEGNHQKQNHRTDVKINMLKAIMENLDKHEELHENITREKKTLRIKRTIKLLEENIGKTLSDIHHSRILYDPPPRILEIKAKINKLDLINLMRAGGEGDDRG